MRVFGFIGFAYAEYTLLIIAMIISGFIGTLIGKKVLIKLGHKYFKIVLNVVLTLISLNLIWNAIIISNVF